MSEDTKKQEPVHHLLPIVFRRSRRVILRPIERGDIPLFQRWLNDPEVTMFLDTYLPITEMGENEWYEKHHTRMPNDIVLGIVAEGRLIGSMGLHKINWKNRTASTGTVIGDKECWSKGFGTEAKMLLLDYAFNVLNLRKVCSMVLAYNPRSAAYGRKCGYKPDGEGRKQQHYYAGKYWDEIQLAVYREDWEPLWEMFAREHGIKIEPGC